MRLPRRPIPPAVEVLSLPERSAESRLLLAILLRGLLDAHQSPADRAWLESRAYESLCELVGVPADRLRRLVLGMPPTQLRNLLRAL